jgi:hypothetical protein
MGVAGPVGTVYPGGQQLEVGPAVRSDHYHLTAEHHITYG